MLAAVGGRGRSRGRAEQSLKGALDLPCPVKVYNADRDS